MVSAEPLLKSVRLDLYGIGWVIVGRTSGPVGWCRGWGLVAGEVILALRELDGVADSSDDAEDGSRRARKVMSRVGWVRVQCAVVVVALLSAGCTTSDGSAPVAATPGQATSTPAPEGAIGSAAPVGTEADRDNESVVVTDEPSSDPLEPLSRLPREGEAGVFEAPILDGRPLDDVLEWAELSGLTNVDIVEPGQEISTTAEFDPTLLILVVEDDVVVCAEVGSAASSC